ncbi:ATP-binding protein [Pseudomonas aeruginosa]|nr:ATP-binding protein [Pseudomonas aeruginosa]EKW4488836.1 ATP-binding protein [Pseudomonas aeruginosa]EKY0073535.1 ATP-binding protein [Pseudomonas aeruginosa]EKY0499311.1 ATP-binding protein [Pseudomonas aeruginosa]EKY1843563.1 ATP-binding protein [Pseudomonas aeruginosa]ELN4433888.1 ATP-binding protein [Pseudomonas aeruginosa]
MAQARPWSFYGRRSELLQMQQVLERKRWFFLQISGRRRIGKTTLIQQALQAAGIDKTLYIQIPDSDPTGVVAACNEYLNAAGLVDSRQPAVCQPVLVSQTCGIQPSVERKPEHVTQHQHLRYQSPYR